MASTTTQYASRHSTTFEPLELRATTSSKQDVQSTLNYYEDPGDGSGPEPTYIGRPETYDMPIEPFDVTVHDIRGDVGRYTLDGNGFQLLSHTSKEKEFLDEDNIKKEYYKEVEQLLKDVTGATRVFIFDHTIRRAPVDTSGDPSRILNTPVQRVHIDQSYAACRSRVRQHFPDEADELLKTRHQIINVWRPIKTILKDPLAVADAHSVPDSDLVPVSLIYPHRRGETLIVRPNKNHKWYFLYGQTPEEVTLIKCSDSKLDGRARRAPHSAFVNPATVNEQTRESIEVRAVVCTENEPAE